VVTIREVADAAGVSTATVSRLLSGRRVNNPEQIQKIIDRLGYRPNPVAIGLRTGMHRTIGVISPDTSNSLLAEVVQGIQREARALGYRVLVGDSNEDAALELELMHDLAQRTDGLLIFPVNEEGNVLDYHHSLPLVLVDRDSFHDEPHDLVAVDNARGGQLAVEHLVRFGHTRIATITGPLTSYPGRMRYVGFRDAMQDAGLELPEEYVVDGRFDDAGGAAAMAALLALPQPPTAVFVANNTMTMGAYAELRARGVKIPDELSLIGFDDFRLADLLTPSVTVIDRPTAEQGRTAARLMFDRIRDRAKGNSGEPVHLNLDVSLTVRESTGPVPFTKEQA